MINIETNEYIELMKKIGSFDGNYEKTIEFLEYAPQWIEIYREERLFNKDISIDGYTEEFQNYIRQGCRIHTVSHVFACKTRGKNDLVSFFFIRRYGLQAFCTRSFLSLPKDLLNIRNLKQKGLDLEYWESSYLKDISYGITASENDSE